MTVALLAAACGGGERTSSSASSSTAPDGPVSSPVTGAPAAGAPGVPRLHHLVVVLMENLDYRGAMAEPRIAGLAARGARADAYYAVAHPSLPNYLALDTGSTWGVTSDCTDCFVSGPDLAQQLSSAGVSWGAYMEGVPGPCFLGASTNGYAGKHNPFRYVRQVRDSPTLCGHLRPLGDLESALAGPPGSVPAFAWVTPDLCHDGHDCDPAQAGAWLRAFAARVGSSRSWDADSALVVTWDESDGDSRGGGGHVLTFALSPSISPGRRVSTTVSHYSLLRTVEEAFGLPFLGHAGDPGRADLASFWG